MPSWAALRPNKASSYSSTGPMTRSIPASFMSRPGELARAVVVGEGRHPREARGTCEARGRRLSWPPRGAVSRRVRRGVRTPRDRRRRRACPYRHGERRNAGSRRTAARSGDSAHAASNSFHIPCRTDRSRPPQASGRRRRERAAHFPGGDILPRSVVEVHERSDVLIVDRQRQHRVPVARCRLPEDVVRSPCTQRGARGEGSLARGPAATRSVVNVGSRPGALARQERGWSTTFPSSLSRRD